MNNNSITTNKNIEQQGIIKHIQTNINNNKTINNDFNNKLMEEVIKDLTNEGIL